MIRKRYSAVVLAILLMNAASAWAAVKLASPFGEHMVLEQGIPVPIWGTATGGGEWVTVRFAGQTAFTIADADGNWIAWLAPLKAGGPYNMTVSENWFNSQLNDVLVGDVYLVAGGTDASGLTTGAPIAAPLSPFVRIYKVDPQTAAGGKWIVSSQVKPDKYSATTYSLGRELYNKLKVPIGLVDMSYGGSSAPTWIGSKVLASPDLLLLMENRGN